MYKCKTKYDIMMWKTRTIKDFFYIFDFQKLGESGI